jgi:ATP-binding cassette subfamily B protein
VLLVQVLLGLLGAAVAGAGLVWAVVQVRAGRLTAGDLVVLVAAVASVQAGLAGLVGQLAGGHQVLLQFGHFDQTLRGGVDLPEPEQPAALPALRKGIELRDVWFRYDESQPWVLRGVSLTVPCGQSVALVGLNGAGKSTLVKLLCRLYDPVRGSILWDGVDIRSVPVAELRARIAAVFQDHMNYDFTAGENIGLGDLDALGDPSRLRAAARSAEIDDTISALPRGYQTMLSRLYRVGDDADEDELGVPLSGGQWQRVALARGLVRGRRELLILDEPSSGLDAEAEHRIHQRLATMREGGAAVLISHRLNAVRMADQIVVLSGGAIVESGTHDELVAADGAYARLFRLQSAGYVTVRAAGQRP